MGYGLQLYSLRDITGKDMRGALLAAARQGYACVEFAGFFGHTPQEVAHMLSEAGLTASGTHTGLDQIQDHFEETVAYHKAIGATQLIVPYADLCSQEKLDAFIATVNPLRERLAQEGIRLCYHNHDMEFKPNPDGSVAFEQLVYRTALDLQIDTFWAFAAGVDPVALMERLHARVPVIHIKDGLKNGHGMPLGQGEAPVKAVFEAARRLSIPMVVESETLTPDGLSEAGICINYLRALS